MVARKTSNVIQRYINRSTRFEARQEIAPLPAFLVRPHLECCVRLGSAVSEGYPRGVSWKAGKNLGNVAGRGEDYRGTQVATLKPERVAFMWH